MEFGECAFDTGKRSCSALKEKRCAECNFYKTEEELKKGRAKAEKMLQALPDEQRKAYRDKYFINNYSIRNKGRYAYGK